MKSYEVKHVVNDAAPGITEVGFVLPEEDDSTHIFVRAHPYVVYSSSEAFRKRQSAIPSTMRTALMLNVTGARNPASIAFPNPEYLEGDSNLQQRLTCFLGEIPLTRLIHGDELTSVDLTDEHLTSWSRAFDAEVEAIHNWNAITNWGHSISNDLRD